MKYKRICQGLDAIGILIPINENPYKHINPKNDSYISIYEYTEDQKELFNEVGERINKKTGTTYTGKRGCSGITNVKTNWFVFDFDDEENQENAKKDALELVSKLNKLGISEKDLLITFSGNKGFGVEFKTDKYFNPQEVKKICKNLHGSGTWDSKVYNSNRIMRLPFTKHQKTGLFKIPLSLEELKTLEIDKIKEIAKDEYEPELISLPENKTPVYFSEILETEKIKENPKIELTDKPDFSNKPSHLSNWKYALQEGFFPPGSRNNALMILAATYQGLGYKKEHTYRLLKGVAELQAQRYKQERYPDENLWKEIIMTVYSPLWNGGTYAEDNFPEEIVEHLNDLGVEKTKQDELSLIETIDTGFDGFINYAENIDKYTMKFGIKSLDEKLKVRKGHIIDILAGPGVGKTSFSITLLNNMSKSNIGCYFGSYDMYKNNVYQKLIQRHTGLSEDEMYEYFKTKNISKINEFREILCEEYKNVSFCFKVGQTIEDLKRSISLEEERRGVNIELVVVDYLELILTNATDPTAASAEAAQGLREIANEGRVVVRLLQPNKMSSNPNEPLTSYNAAKGSSSIAQSATAILTAHRPGLSSIDDNANDKYFGINCVKNRNGSLFALDFAWEGKTQKISDLDIIGKAQLKALRDMRTEDARNLL